MKWTKNTQSDLPGLTERNVLVGEWSGYEKGWLVATVHRDQANGHWFAYRKLADGTVERCGVGWCSRLADAKSRARNWRAGEKPGPNAEQLAAVRAFATKYAGQRGGWKEHLITCWMNGADAREPDGHLLRQVRNQAGPSWLQTWEG